jgi:hypothetical protein
MLTGWVNYLQLKAKVKTGFSPAVAVFAVIAVIASAMTFILLIFTAFIWLAERYSALTAALILSLFFLLIAILAAVCALMTQRRVVERAKLALEARSNSPWLDPTMVATMLQLGRSVGLRRIVPLVAAGFLAAGFAKEWLRDRTAEEAEASEEAES